jgi:hypothetical protein
MTAAMGPVVTRMLHHISTRVRILETMVQADHASERSMQRRSLTLLLVIC